jgi:membrane-associated phospholipid phosphatase
MQDRPITRRGAGTTSTAADRLDPGVRDRGRPDGRPAGVGGSRGHAGLGAELRHDASRLIGGGVVVYVLLAVTGLVITRVFPNGPIIRTDQRISRWFFEHRTPTLSTLTHYGTMLADTMTAIALTVVLVVGLRLWLHRWREAVTILVSILGELFIFVLVTATVHRQRPLVPHLDPAPPTSSFPSGHTGASVALYVGLSVVLWHVARTSSRASATTMRAITVVLCLVPVVVGLSRIYRGMHYPTDVVAGALAGGLWMLIAVSTLLPRSDRART